MTDPRHKLLVIGIGNPECGDDGAGPAVVKRIEHSHPDDIQTQIIAGDPSHLIGAMKGRSFVVLVDAILSQNAMGALHVLDATKVALPVDLFGNVSTHGFGLANAIEMARALGELPKKLVVLGIEGEKFEPGDGMSPRVKEAVTEATRWVLERSDAYSIIGND
ncbi:hydrogenase maturation protease superfamily [Verrucomicrobiia bacterium DG1235]|nr:hydrogenase maturation protease superfamily [Verrucomicrobiae bacterium DG1235]